MKLFSTLVRAYFGGKSNPARSDRGFKLLGRTIIVNPRHRGRRLQRHSALRSGWGSRSLSIWSCLQVILSMHVHHY